MASTAGTWLAVVFIVFLAGINLGLTLECYGLCISEKSGHCGGQFRNNSAETMQCRSTEPIPQDSCTKLVINGTVTRSCGNYAACEKPKGCYPCKGVLCNTSSLIDSSVVISLISLIFAKYFL